MGDCAGRVPACGWLRHGSTCSGSGRGLLGILVLGWTWDTALRGAPQQVIAALDQALGDLELRPIQHARDGTVVRIEAKTKDNRRVAATIRAYAGTSQVAVRIGRFGDEPLSRSILDRVDIRLGSRDPEAIPGTPPSVPAHNPFFSRDAVPDSDMLRDFVEAPFRDRVIP